MQPFQSTSRVRIARRGPPARTALPTVPHVIIVRSRQQLPSKPTLLLFLRLVDADTYHSMGCNGGQPGSAWKWFTKTGVVTGGDFADIGTGTTCKASLVCLFLVLSRVHRQTGHAEQPAMFVFPVQHPFGTRCHASLAGETENNPLNPSSIPAWHRQPGSAPCSHTPLKHDPPPPCKPRKRCPFVDRRWSC